MKIRQGFISNSSSSSFILGFDKKPKSTDEVKKLFFAGMNHVSNVCYYGDNNEQPTFGTGNMAVTIFDDLQRAEPLTEDQILEEIRNGYFEDAPEFDYGDYDKVYAFERDYKERTGKDIRDNPKSKEYKIWNKMFNEIHKRRDEEWDEAAKQFWKNRKKDFKGKQVFVLSYSDNDSDYHATLEHGGVLDGNDKVACIKINHH